MNFGKNLQNALALERQVRAVLLAHFPSAVDKSRSFEFRCNICGDSKKSTRKRRGTIIKNNMWYYCHNCFASMPVSQWMKTYFPIYYKDYVKEILFNQGKKSKSLPKIESKKDDYDERKDVRHFRPILSSDDELFKEAQELCKRRKIPEEIWHKWFVAVDGKFFKRLIIPFFDHNGQTYYYQARAIEKDYEPKYISRVGGDFISIYNYYTVDRSKPVIILEGMIDSIFVNNSVAVTGLKIGDSNLDVFKQKYFLLDSDKAGRLKSMDLLSNGEYVFVWKTFLKDLGLEKREKWDMNDVYLETGRTEQFTFEELEQYFTNNIFSKALLL